MDGDREACLAAGMDDYITKPIRLDAIAAVLQRWTNRDGATQQPQPPAPQGGEPLPDPLDPYQIDLLRSLDDGAGAVLGEIIDQYLTQTVQGRGELLRVVRNGDPRAAERAAHNLKGASANIGATVLAAVCAQIERHAHQAQLDGAGDLVQQFDSEFARVRDALSQLAPGA